MPTPNQSREIAADVLRRLEKGWNTADGDAFGEPFTEDADFVDIRGSAHRSRIAIARGHQAVFDSIYRGSVIRYEVTDARTLNEATVLAHVAATLHAPAGPLAGDTASTLTLVIVREGGSWRVAACHNTLVAKG